MKEGLHVDVGKLKSLAIPNFHDNAFYKANMYVLSVLTRAVINFVKYVMSSAPSYAPTIYSNAKTFLGKLRAAFPNHHKGPIGDIVAFLNTPLSHTRTTSISFLQIFFSCMHLKRYDAGDRKGPR